MRNLLIVAAIALALTGCTKTMDKVYVYTPRPVPVEPSTQPVHTKNVEWIVLTQDELKKKLAELEKNPDPKFVLFALTPQGFENLNANLIEINRFVQEQQQVVFYYRRYITETSANPTPEKTK